MSRAIRFESRGAHTDLLNCTDTEVAAVGRAGSGKTLAAAWKMHLTALAVPELRGLMLRATHTSLVATTLITFQRAVAAEALANGTVKWFGGSGRDPAAFRYPNGSTIMVAGGDRPEKFLSAELDRIFCDEAVELSLELHETLISRLRGSAPTYKQVILATNPSFPQHWIKRRVDDGKLTMFTSTHQDNPHYVNPDGSFTEAGLTYLEKLDSLTGVRAQRLRDGRWTTAEGVVYEEFDESVHVVPRFTPPSDWRRYWVVDFGYSNPFVWQDWREDPDGRLWLVRELYSTRGLVEDHARSILQVMQEYPEEPEPLLIICDHDAEDRATLERYLGRPTVAAKKTVSDGIQAVQARLRVQGDGRPRVLLMRNAGLHRDSDLVDAGKPTSTEDEFPAYVWAPKVGGLNAVKEVPLKEGDHGMDCLRYLCAQLDLRGVAVLQSPLRSAGGPRKSGGTRTGSRYARSVG